ncbi:MAG: hypothetical protein QOC95_609, partial [Thermoleophilaceae bacterium]|nr:hypothetical protein [Thermoleophilaceae bacterium]
MNVLPTPAIRFVRIALVAVLGAYAAHVYLHLGGHAADPLFDTWVHDGLFLFAAALCVLRAVRTRGETAPWLCFAVALGTYALGEIL